MAAILSLAPAGAAWPQDASPPPGVLTPPAAPAGPTPLGPIPLTPAPAPVTPAPDTTTTTTTAPAPGVVAPDQAPPAPASEAPAPAAPAPAAPPTATPAPPTPAPPPPNVWLPKPVADLMALDKVTARATKLTVRVGQSVAFGALAITVRGCVVRPPDQAADAAVALDITDGHTGGSAVFHGWMLLNEPSLSVLAHPLYDIRLAGCHE
jgi:hypothetical protein